jgi:hypothetical protein
MNVISVAGSMLICLGSTLSALVGVLLLNWTMHRRRWRGLWLLAAGVFLIGAGFGAAETIYQMAAEHEEDQRLLGTPLSVVPLAGTPPPTERPRSTSTPSPTATPEATPTPRPTLVQAPSPTAPSNPTPGTSSSDPSEDVRAMAQSLIPAEQGDLATLDDPPHYILNVSVDFDALTVSGTAEIQYTNNEAVDLEALYLRLYPNADHYEEGETRIDAVNVDGAAVRYTFEDPERTVLQVPLPSPLAPDAGTRLQIGFEVQVPRRSDRFGYDQGVMSLGHWYPMLAVYDDEGWNLDPYVALGDAFYSDVALFTVHLTVPEGIVVAATGVQAGSMVHRPPSETHIYVSGATRDFALALSQEYAAVDTRVGDTTVTSYYLPGHAQGGRQALQVAAQALRVYNERFGIYPYSELDVAETSFTVMGSPGGMEFPGIVFISEAFYRPGGLFGSEMDTVVAHEVAHQWWYGVVGNNQVDEPWLDEAFATYSSILYFEETGGRAEAEMAFLSQAQLPYQLIRLMGSDGPLQSSLLDYRDDLLSYQSLIYSKGALFLGELRELLGDADFVRLLQHHYQAHQYGLLARDDFRRSLEEALSSAPEKLAGALELYDAVVVRGESIESGLGLEGLEGLLEGQLSPEELNRLMELLGQMLEGFEP